MECDLIASTPDAAWLPPGSTAEVWAGEDCRPPDHAIIVRLLLVRANADAARGAEFFCVETAKGLDLPTLFLGPTGARMTTEQGLEALCREVCGTSLPLRCVGFVRNVVPTPDASYPHPVPHAHVPVFAPQSDVTPTAGGMWVDGVSARSDLAARHWWPIVERHLQPINRSRANDFSQ
ncbi:NUDIX hydrolase [Rudaeicoccus suwonensis]|nr:NUDIX hydrolase [Rudaeicoccus suwonensis]